MSDQKPRLQIPVSQSMRNLETIEVELMFDEPFTFEGEKWNTYYYTVKDLQDGVEKSLAASEGLHKFIQRTGAIAGSVVSLARVGEGTATKYDVEHVSGPARTTTTLGSPPRAAKSPSANGSSSGSKVYSPLDSDEMEVFLRIIEHELHLYEATLALVSGRPALAELNKEQQARIATGMIINAKRIYSPGIVVEGEESPSDKRAERQFLADVNAAPEDDKVAAVLDAIVQYTSMDARSEVTGLLSRYGLSSEDIVTGSEEEILDMYKACKMYIDLVLLGGDETAIAGQVADEFGYRLEEPPF